MKPDHKKGAELLRIAALKRERAARTLALAEGQTGKAATSARISAGLLNSHAARLERFAALHGVTAPEKAATSPKQ